MAAAVPTNWQSKALLAADGVSGVCLGASLPTLVLGVLERPAEDLERAGYVERVVGWEEGE